MSKSDKLIYNTLFNLKDYCSNRSDCKSCQFSIKEDDNNHRCILVKLSVELSVSPYMYNMNEIRRLLEYDIQKDD